MSTDQSQSLSGMEPVREKAIFWLPSALLAPISCWYIMKLCLNPWQSPPIFLSISLEFRLWLGLESLHPLKVFSEFALPTGPCVIRELLMAKEANNSLVHAGCEPIIPALCLAEHLLPLAASSQSIRSTSRSSQSHCFCLTRMSGCQASQRICQEQADL